MHSHSHGLQTPTSFLPELAVDGFDGLLLYLGVEEVVGPFTQHLVQLLLVPLKLLPLGHAPGGVAVQ